MKEYKYKTTFAAKIVPVVSEEVDKYLAVASKNNLEKYFPKNIDFKNNIGFQGFVGEAFICNKLNANSDGLKAKEGVSVAEMMPFSYIDANHARQHLIGVIADYSFVEFGTNKQLDKSEAKKMTSPFSVVIGGIIWKAPNPNVADAVENSSNPASDFYEKLYCSWELAFDKFDLIIINANKTNFEDGKIITDETEIKSLTKKLQVYGGNGFTDDGMKIGRIPIDDVVPLGVGLVENPAGQVKPIIPLSISSKSQENVVKTIENAVLEQVIEVKKDGSVLSKPSESNENQQNSENKISQAQKDVVKDNNDNIKSNMKIEKIDQLTDENLKEIKVADLKQLFASDATLQIEKEIKKISEDYTKRIGEKDALIKAAQDNVAELDKTVKEIQEKFNKTTEDLNKLNETNRQREQVETFSARMEVIKNEFELDTKQEEIIANKVKSLTTDKDFTDYRTELDVLLAAKKKAKNNMKDDDNDKNKEDDEDEDDKKDKKDKKTSKASVNDDKAAIDEALKNAKKDEKVIPNAGGTEPTLLEKAQKAFGVEGWNFVDKRKNRII